MLRFLGNVIWFLFGGLWLALAWGVLGLLLCITVVGIPFGVQCFKLASVSLAPYGKRVQMDYAKHPLANLLWALLAGWEIALLYLVAGLFNCITVIGISRGIQCFKLTRLALFPFGARIK